MTAPEYHSLLLGKLSEPLVSHVPYSMVMLRFLFFPEQYLKGKQSKWVIFIAVKRRIFDHSRLLGKLSAPGESCAVQHVLLRFFFKKNSCCSNLFKKIAAKK